MNQKATLPCQHTSPAKGCAFCTLVARDSRYARLFDVPAPRRPAPPAAPTVARIGDARCLHLGEPTGQTVTCPSCLGTKGVQLKTFACDRYRTCTIAKAAPGVACCATCPDYVSADDGTKMLADSGRSFPLRDCLYHVYPLPAGARIWRRGLSMLLARASLFTGRKVISCMTGGDLESPSVVRRMAQPHGFEVVELANDPKLRETKTLLELLPRFETSDPERALFFGHAKGVTKEDNLGVTCHPWAVLCHEVTLDYWPLVEAQLQNYPITGLLLKSGRCFDRASAFSRSTWHYSGTFYWLRSADFFTQRDWRNPDRMRFGAESSVGVWFRHDEAGCLFHRCGPGTRDLYRMEEFMPVLCEYALWRVEHEGMRTERARVTS